jgi:hypothetical protein
MFWLVALLGLGWVFFNHCDWLKGVIPESWGPVPVGVPWYGALGAVLLSLAGVFYYRGNAWDGSWVLWHVARPFVGAALGIVSVVILQAGMLSVGSGATAVTPGLDSQPRNALYYLIAFLVGYREITFRDLIRRVSDVLFGGSAGTALTITAANPSSAPYATPSQVVVTGSGFNQTSSVAFDKDLANQVQVDSDTQLTVMTPKMSGVMDVHLTVRTKDASATYPFKFV